MDYRGRIWKDYVFIPNENKIIFRVNPGVNPDIIGSGDIERLLLITNVTKNEILYSPQIEGKGYVLANFPLLILEHDCSAHDSDDHIQIIIEADWLDMESLRTVAEARAQQTQVGILKTLLKIEKQLEIITDEQITENDIAGPGLKRK